ncbi:sister chromatid cohesion protein PDS5 homolog C-like [Pyrus x bretschneideri]|uniref:sister chromatid cohesion protein PDS5 homolog C-like n=1 Tax=Pyrus x bretschneideri TaxID=225117 RepID=UPI00202E5242|nr:sister chromatid cohesion protein PDS5 homolog C-like [Pyrus x bretschneideri]
MASAEKELEAQLTEAGNQLLEPPSSVDDLLDVLDRVENCLSKVEQSPTTSMQTALSPSQNALVAEELFRHPNPDVKVGVAACISEITRITAPDAPYDDEQMKEVFHLIVSSFENLHDKSSRSYAKRASILETVAKVRSCVVMLDLECDALIVEMFQHFLKAIRDYHPENVFSSMETIMTLVLEESEEVSAELLSPLLASVKNDNEDILPIGRKLGERVLESCATKLKDYLVEEVKSLGIVFDDYSKVVASICQEASDDAEQNEGRDADGNVAAEEKSAIRESSDEAAQVDKEKAEATVSPERIDPAVDRSSKLVVNNGNAETGEDDSVAESNALKKEEEGDNTEDQKDPNASSNGEPDSLETEKAADAEQIPEKATKGAGNSDLSTKSTQPSENCQADNEEDTETQPEHKSKTEDVPSSPHEDPSVEAAVQSENEKVSDVNLSSKLLEKEPAGVASPSPSESLPDVSRSKKAGRNKKKDSSNKGAAPFADDEHQKVTDGTSDSELKPSRRSGKQASAGVSNENKSPTVVETSRKESATTSDSEAKQKSAKKVDGSTKTSDGSPIKQAVDKRKRGRGKVTPAKAATKSSAKDDDKEMVSTPKSAPKLTKDESPLEETPKTNSKRKRASGKEKESGDKDHGEEMVGSKIKVWWPKDRTFYEGVVAYFDSAKKKHKVSYTDGDVETLNLKKERWEFVADDPDSDEEQGTDQLSHDASSDVPLKKKVKKTPDDSTKKEKMDTSPKSGGGASSSKSKGATAKFDRKLKEGSKADSKSKGGSGKSDDERIGKLKDHTPKSSGKSVDVAQKTSSKSKNNDTHTPKSTKSKEDDSTAQKAQKASKSKQDTQKAGKSNQSTLKTASVSKGKSSASSGKANANGTGKAKAASKPTKEDEDMKEASSDSEKAPESTPKGKSPTLAKVLASETKSGKKRRRGSKS